VRITAWNGLASLHAVHVLLPMAEQPPVRRPAYPTRLAARQAKPLI